jgi:methyl-accepting chemotaxis protein
MRGLSESTTKIGDVVHLISDIAGQTNLLADNLQNLWLFNMLYE